MSALDHAALLTLGLITRRNPLRPGVIVAALGTVNGTPHVLVDDGGARRRAAYLAPHAAQAGNVFVVRQGAALDAPLLIALTNYQVALTSGGTSGTGATLGLAPTDGTGVPAGGRGAATGGGVGADGRVVDLALAMRDTTRRRGALLPLTLGRARV